MVRGARREEEEKRIMKMHWFERTTRGFMVVLIILIASCASANETIRKADARIAEARALDAAVHAPDHLATAESALASARS